MTTRTRSRTDQAEGDATPEAPAPEQPADEAQAERTDGPAPDETRDRLDALGQVLDGIAQRVTELAQRETPPPDLDDLHTRFDVLSDELGRFIAPQSEVLTAPVPDVLGKVLDLMRQVDEIGKEGTAPAKMGGYSFRKVDSAIDAVGRAVRSIGLVLRSEVVDSTMFPRHVGSNANSWGARVTMRYVFVSPVDGSEHAVEGVGEGADSGDKATSKAVSMALKYALLQGLMIPVEGAHLDVESEDTRAENALRNGGRRDDRQPPPRDERRDQRPPQDGQRQGGTSETDPPEVRAAEVLRIANDGRPADAVQALLGRAGEAGLLGVEIESYGERATLQQHLLAVIRLARGGSR